MTKILIVLALVVPFMIGCSDSIVNPDSTAQVNNSQKSWITLPNNPGMAVEDEYSASRVINGDIGGNVLLKINYKSRSSANVIIVAEIDVPAGAYTGDKNITMIINSTNGTATFYPSPETFNKPLLFNLKISGVELNGFDPNSIDFEYLAPDGSMEPIQYKKIVVNTDVLKVEDALIPHFSIYGWCR